MDLASPSVTVESWVKRAKAPCGDHPAVSVGLSLGGGCTVRVWDLGSSTVRSPFSQHPGRLKISSKRTSRAIDPLIKHPAMKRLAGYVKGKPWPL